MDKDIEKSLRNADLRNADLRNADLRNADLRNADLRGADLSGADLRGADLRGANLSGADLSGADLSGANLWNANLWCADLSGADLSEANLLRADLSEANLLRADLSEANIWNANLRGVKLDEENVSVVGAIGFPIHCPEEGSFIAFKKAGGRDNSHIVKLLVPEDAKRTSATTNKCRCDKALVMEILNLDGTISDVRSIQSRFDHSFVYTVGEMVSVPDFDEDRFNECSRGIHFFITMKEAVEYGK